MKTFLAFLFLLILAGAPKNVVVIQPPEDIEVKAGESVKVKIPVAVARGFHIQANPASKPYLIPSKLVFEESKHLKAIDPVYPPGKIHRLKGSAESLSTYKGTFKTEITVVAAADTPAGEQSLRGKFHYQACDESVCLRPQLAGFELKVFIVE